MIRENREVRKTDRETAKVKTEKYEYKKKIRL